MSSRMERKKEENQRAILNAIEKLIAEKGITLIMENMAQKLILKKVPNIFTSVTRKVCLLQLMLGLIRNPKLTYPKKIRNNTTLKGLKESKI
jgi:hypothetical protein